MARLRLALMLATALTAAAMSRADAQPVPTNPTSLPDPAAILLPPVANDDSTFPLQPVRTRSTLPELTPTLRETTRTLPVPTAEPVARIRLQEDDYVTVRATDYEQSQRASTSYSDPDSARRGTNDPYGYLMNGLDDRKSRSSGVAADDRSFTDKIGDRIDSLLGRGKGGLTGGLKRDDGRRFNSDRAFEGFISPVTNPFFFEDPRSLTEIRPIALFQQIPSGQPSFRGGNSMFFGTQARLALGDRWSVVMNKIGASLFRPGSGSALSSETGLSELWIGPKVVLIRNPEFQTLVSAGATFQIPLGSKGVFQDTGNLSITPYVSAAQKLMSTEWGTINGLASAGYSFSVNKDRSDFFYASAHIDFDVNNKHRFYPLAELNWFAYTTDGRSRTLGVEGRDLANIGAASKGANLVTWAIGGRYKANDRWEFGAAFEAPLIGPRDLFRSRFTIDLIWRY
jgi:hypothetical protein